MLSTGKGDEAARLRILLQEKNDKLEDLRNGLKTSQSENAKLAQQLATQTRQLQIFQSEKIETQRRFETTASLAKRLELKLQMTASGRGSPGSPQEEKIMELEDRLQLARKKMDKQNEVLKNLSEENAVLTRAVSLHCRDSNDSADLLRDNADLSLQVERMQADLRKFSQASGELAKIRNEMERLQAKLDMAEAKNEMLQSQMKIIPDLKSAIAESELKQVLSEAKVKALSDDNSRLAENVKEIRKVVEMQESSLLSISQESESHRAVVTAEKARRLALEKQLLEFKLSREDAELSEGRALADVQVVTQNSFAQDELISRLRDEISSLQRLSQKEKAIRTALQDELNVQKDIINQMEARGAHQIDQIDELKAVYHRYQREIEGKNKQINKLGRLLGADTLAKSKRLVDN